MGEKEQSGMLRNVVVIGIIAIIAMTVIFAVVNLTGTMTKNSDKAVGTIATTAVPYGVTNSDVKYEKYTPSSTANSGWGDHATYFPVVGDIPTNSWREDRLVVRSSERVYIRVDVNNNPEAMTTKNDNDDLAKRSLDIYKDGVQIVSTNSLYNKVWLDKDTDYTIVVKYFNNSGQTFIERADDRSYRVTDILSGTEDGSSYNFQIKSFEAATYDNKYVS